MYEGVAILQGQRVTIDAAGNEIIECLELAVEGVLHFTDRAVDVVDLIPQLTVIIARGHHRNSRCSPEENFEKRMFKKFHIIIQFSYFHESQCAKLQIYTFLPVFDTTALKN